jgi:hypothetical protein
MVGSLNQERMRRKMSQAAQVFLFPVSNQATEPIPLKFTEAIKEVFEYWKEQCDHSRALLDSKRAGLILQQLKLGRTIQDLKLAIDGASIDPFSQGKNDRHQKYDDISLILRDAPHVEKFIDIALEMEAQKQEYHRPALEPNLEERELSDAEYEAIFHRRRSRQ